MRNVPQRRTVVLALGFVAACVVLPRAASADGCGSEPEDGAAVAATVAAARDACRCDAFTRPASHRACVRGVVGDAAAAGALRRQCRGEAMRFANRSTCGARQGSVACCRTTAAGRESCTIAVSPERCRPPRGGEARLGASESCFDACLPSHTPAPTPTPVVTPTGAPARCCGCGCPPPYYLACPFSQHQCSVPAPDVTTDADCDAYDVPGWRDCEFIVACDAMSGGIWFPYCTGP